jgi:Amt family ammonium transporter
MLMNLPRNVLAALMTLASLGGFLLYQCGLARAKNSGHTCTLLLVGVLFGLTGYWIGGFAVQTGGIGDTHAALTQAVPAAERTALNHEVGPVLFGHHWGLMGSSGFFLVTDDSTRDGIAVLFLAQAALLTIVVAAALGGALERSKLLAMGFCAYLFGWLVYPLLANWVWGGGWLAELGREFGLGHGFVDVGGACVVHQSAGILALVLAVILGPRHGRFGRSQPSFTIPGHNVPFIVLGTIVLLISWMATNAFAADAALPGTVSSAGLAAINTLLAATGGLVTSFIQAAVEKSRPEPARLCRGLLGGAVASCGGAGLIDPWAAFVIGCVAALLVQQVMVILENKRIDDPVGASAVHGAGGIWGAIAVGFFANGSAGDGLNSVPHEVRGLFYGGAWHQLVAQILGCVTGFVVIYLLGYAFVNLVQKILGNRVDLADETNGLDWTEVGALGYQGDVEPEEPKGKS